MSKLQARSRRELRTIDVRVEDSIARLRPRRKVQGIAAALLPFERDGRIAVEAFQKHLLATRDAGLRNAVNMDTGYVNYLTPEERLSVLRWSREVLGPDDTFIAGAYIEGLDGDVVSLYRRQMDQIVAHGGTPIIFQTARLRGMPSNEKVAVYRTICQGFPRSACFRARSSVRVEWRNFRRSNGNGPHGDSRT